jgi:hypothetical protein
MEYLICSAATEGSRYVECIERQRIIFGHRYLGLILPDRGSWEENTKLKPEAIREAFKHSDVVLWIDSDCLIDPPDSAPDGNWDVCTMYNFHPGHKIKVSAGFIMFRNNARTRRFLARWDVENMRVKKDHPGFTRALNRMPDGLIVSDMTDWLKGRHQINALAPERGVVRA